MTQEVLGAVALGRQGNDSVVKIASHERTVKEREQLTGIQEWRRVGYVSTLSIGEGMGWTVDECEPRKQWLEEEQV
jgi:hypothetical protein